MRGSRVGSSSLAFFVLSSYFVIGAYCNDRTDIEKDRSFSSAIVSMQELVKTESMAIDTLEEYAAELQDSVNVIREAVALMRKANKAARENSEEYLKNPINAFNLVRRTHEDWRNWLPYLALPIGNGKLATLEQMLIRMPTKTDVIEAIDSILLLQETYEIKSEDFVRGLFRGKQYDARFSDLDAYFVGVDLLSMKNNYDATIWLEAALKAYKPNVVHKIYDFNKQKVLSNYAEAFMKQNRFDEALNVLKELQAIDPKSMQISRRLLEVKALVMQQPKPAVLETNSTYEADYDAGCRGSYDQRQTNLHCRLNTNTTPFLRLAPIKYEELSLDPYILVYHDVLYDNEIESLKKLAAPNLARAKVLTENYTRIVSNVRTAKFAWLEDFDNELIKRLDYRLTDMTGFAMNGSEALQMANYGLGGYYLSHYDYLNVSLLTDVGRFYGNRKATVLFYLTDVEQGGSTVFPRIGISKSAKKGTALMWYNVDNKGNADRRTKHASCPVLYGNKWIFTKWIRENPQMFLDPCAKQ